MYEYILCLPALFIVCQALRRLSHVLFDSLGDIPGPIWTRFFSIWYFNRVIQGNFEHDNFHLHQKYGPVVRIAPNQYSINDLSAIKTVYGTRSRFAKSAWYDGWRHPQQWTVFSDRDINRHAETRKRFTGLYAMSSVMHYETFVDHCADIFIKRMSDFADKRQTVNLGHWFQCYAFDVIGNITFGDTFAQTPSQYSDLQLGFLDRGDDINGAIDAVDKVMKYSTLIGIYPEWHPRIFGLLRKLQLSGANGMAFISNFVREKIRLREEKFDDSSKAASETVETQDFLDKLILARNKDPERLTGFHLFIMSQSNMTAGSDTTAISLSAIIWYLAQNPEVLTKLRNEIEIFTVQGHCSINMTFKESQEMPYFQAVIKEALRMHSAVGLPLWRVVPPGGADIGGRFFPEGTVVGVNPWVAHYDERVFPNAKTFQPERWLEAESDPERLKEMNSMYMPFGLGSRTCLGRHIAILEISKLIPRIVRDYDITPLRKNWTTQNYWFVKPTDFEVKVQRKASA
ncbi:hypothetical protein N7495_001007 [Penicillium taxi]|uniref:uncharacterized protein n=1 Tax=Penicillium taxi TaxID=168475 RepID=UPI00254510AA|nr:uncharacterized protein N7495_001007 [Penicillium taxi]KAJ5908325.1 hypothetical protein N7495_001007 [Penicillium taxi]